jgi:hypothetical protein
VRKIDNAHDAVDEAQAGGDEKEDGGIENGIQRLNDQGIHSCPVCACLKIPFADDVRRLKRRTSNAITAWTDLSVAFKVQRRSRAIVL